MRRHYKHGDLLPTNLVSWGFLLSETAQMGAIGKYVCVSVRIPGMLVPDTQEQMRLRLDRAPRKPARFVAFLVRSTRRGAKSFTWTKGVIRVRHWWDWRCAVLPDWSAA